MKFGVWFGAHSGSGLCKGESTGYGSQAISRDGLRARNCFSHWELVVQGGVKLSFVEKRAGTEAVVSKGKLSATVKEQG